MYGSQFWRLEAQCNVWGLASRSQTLRCIIMWWRNWEFCGWLLSELLFCHWVMSNSLRPHGLWPARLCCPWNSPGKNTGVDCHSPLQWISTQESNLGLLHQASSLSELSSHWGGLHPQDPSPSQRPPPNNITGDIWILTWEFGDTQTHKPSRHKKRFFQVYGLDLPGGRSRLPCPFEQQRRRGGQSSAEAHAQGLDHILRVVQEWGVCVLRGLGVGVGLF